MIKKLKSLSKGAKASLVYTLASLITKGIGIITLPFFTNILTQEEVGLTSIFSTWHSMVFIVANLALCSVAYNIGLTDFKQEKKQFTSSLIYLSWIATTVLMLIYFLGGLFSTDGSNTFNEFFTLNTPLMVLMFVSFYIDPAYNFWMAQQRFEYKYKKSAICAILYSVFVAAISMIAVYVMQNNTYDIGLGEVKVYSSTIAAMLFGLFFLLLTLIKGRHKPTIKYWKYILPLCLPLIVHSLAMQLLNVSDRVMISYYVGEAAVGIYSTLYNISSMSLIVWSAINGSLIPHMFEKLQNRGNEKKELGPLIYSLLIMFAIFSIMVTFMAPEIVRVLTNDSYASAVYIVPPIAGGIFLTALYNIVGNVLSYHKKTVYIMICTLIAGITNIGLNALFIPMYGYVAAAYTTLAGYIILSVLIYLIMRFKCKVEIANPLILFGISAITIGVCLLINFIYPFPIVRYIIIGVIILMCLIFRKKIISIFRKLKAK